MIATTQQRDDAARRTQKMPGHWLLAKMGKRVLRPGGRELTERLLAKLAIVPTDHVVEFAPGTGETAKLTLSHCPASYRAVERDETAAATIQRMLTEPTQRCIGGTAENTGLAAASASVIYGEAMLSMQLPAAKVRIISEAVRVLKTGGRYGIHELCLTPDGISEAVRNAVADELSDEIHVGVRPLTTKEWREIIESAGFRIESVELAPMHLLEPARLINDEGFFRAMRFIWNVARHAEARRRVLRMRRVFRKYRMHLAAICIVAVKIQDQ